MPHDAIPTAASLRRPWLIATLGYVLLAVAVTWPLPVHLRTHLLGDPAGDTGVYLWNLWVFSHELLDHGHLPLSTDHLFAYTDGVDFALHNYTPVVGLLGVPLLPLFGVVGAFNLLLLASIAASGLAVFGLSRHIGLRPWAAWFAGAVFTASPVLAAKQTAHTSLVLAAPLPIFVWLLLRTLDTKRFRDAIALGATVAMATYADAYYGIYCILMGLVVLGWRFLQVEHREDSGRIPTFARRVVMVILAAAVTAAVLHAAGLTTVTIGPIRLSLRTLYTPMLAGALALAAGAALRWRVSPSEGTAASLRALWPHGATAVATTLTLLLPMLIGVWMRAESGRLPSTPVYWRSSPRGLDLLSALAPNPNHGWLPSWLHTALMPAQADAFPEFVGSMSLVGLGLVALAAWSRALPRFWVAFTAVFAALSLGPFVHVAGVNTYVIGPWALLRYAPVIGMARSPSRFAVVATLGFAVLVGYALQHAWATRRSWTAGPALIAALLVWELLPVPRTLHSGAVPEAYRFIAADPRPGRVIELPGGIRDGTSSLGDFSPATMFYQTAHGRALLGGYLSRVSDARRRRSRADPVLGALYTLSERRNEGTVARRHHSGPPREGQRRGEGHARRRFLARACLGFVVIDKSRASGELQDFARDFLRLSVVFSDLRYDVLVPVDPPPCERPQPPERRLTATG